MITEAQVGNFLTTAGVLIGAASAATVSLRAGHNVVALRPGGMAAIFAGRTLPDMNAATGAGLIEPKTWFERLSTMDMNGLLRAIFARPGIAAVANGSRAEWLALLFGAAHAETLGATEARSLTLDWSRTGNTFDPADFDRAWASFREDRA